MQDAVENETKPAAEAIPPLEGAIDEASDEAAGGADWPVNSENAMDDQEIPEPSQEPLPQSRYYTDTLTFTIDVVRGEDSDA